MKIIHYRIIGESQVRFGAIAENGDVIDGTDLLDPPDQDRFDLGVRDRFDMARPILARMRARSNTSGVD